MHIKKRQIPDALEEAALLFQQGALQQARTILQAILKADHRQPAALHLLGLTEARQNNLSEAEALLVRAVKEAPQEAEFHNSLGVVLRKQDKIKAAERCYQRCLKLMPGHLEALDNLATLLRHDKRAQEAEQYARKALAALPDNPRLAANLAGALVEQGRLAEPRQLFERVMQQTSDPKILGMAIAGMLEIAHLEGDAEAFVPLYRLGAERVNPDFEDSAYLARLNYVPSWSQQQIAEEHKRCMARLCPTADSVQTMTCSDDDAVKRPLRIGYLSPDFVNHPVGWLLEPVVQCHDPAVVETVLYDVHGGDYPPRPGLQAACTLWRDCRGMSDSRLAELIAADSIDILVELAGHTADNRLAMLARRVAPVQVSWLGYFNTTGVPAIDWLIADPYSVPADEESGYSERVWRLPGFRLPYISKKCPLVEAESQSVGLENIPVRFVSNNNIIKIGPQVLAAWVAILAQLPGATLTVRWKTFISQEVRELFRTRFVQAGGNPQQLELQEPLPHDELLASYRQADIMLDSFPFGGGGTSIDALSMGVPVVTMAGDRMAGRQTQALLELSGHAGLVATTISEYVAIAVALAGDRERLCRLRERLPEDLQQSPQADPVRFTRNLEEAYLAIWQHHLHDE